MSAFIVSHAHISAILDFAIRRDPPRGFDKGDVEKMGRTLMEQNVASVEFRYPSTKGTHAEALAFVFKFPARELTPVEVLKALECYDYQSCETNDYYDWSGAYDIIHHIRQLAIAALPGFREAAWHIT